MTNTGTLAILGGTPVRGPEKSWMTWPYFNEQECAAIQEVATSGKWWFGERVKRFEQEYAAFQDAKHCVTCASGTSAIEIAMRALGIGPGDEVIVPPYTFIATASAVAWAGATPIFADVDDAWNLDPAAVEAAITPRTKAIMPVHFAGRIVDMDRYNEIGRKHNLIIFEDACHSWGSKWRGKGTGALGIGGVFSFQFSKNITGAEGGAILSDNDEFAATCRSLANCGRGPEGSPWYLHYRLGTNSRLTEFQAALLSVQLTRLEEQTLRREQNAAYLDQHLPSIPGISVQTGDPRITRRSRHLYCIRIRPEQFGCTREQCCQAAAAEGLPISPGYGMPLYKQPAFTSFTGHDYTQYHCPVAEDLCATSGIWIHHALLLGAQSDMDDIIAIIQKIQQNAHKLA